MENTNVEWKKFTQTPVFEDDTIFELTGKDMRVIQDVIKSLNEFAEVMKNLFITNLNSGKIKIEYKDMDGNIMSREEVELMVNDYAKLVAQSMQNQTKS